jgi:ribose transport system permease protein
MLMKISLDKSAFTQERIVFALALTLFVVFSVALRGFATGENLITLVRSVSALGILGLGMALVVIGRGIDLSLIATMTISVGYTIALLIMGRPVWEALGMGAALAIMGGIINGFLVAYAEIPALFTTLAMGTIIFGFGRLLLIPTEVVYIPDRDQWLATVGQGWIFGIPAPVIIFLLFSLVVHLFLKRTKPGFFTFAIGDNYPAARITGIPTRPLLMLQYVLCAIMGLIAGVVTASSVASMNTRMFNSTLIYDVILVVVLGGVGLSGGRGGVRNVLVGTALVGILLNGMTIMDIQYTVQNIIKSTILLIALVADSLLNPRDEQTAQQGDI